MTLTEVDMNVAENKSGDKKLDAYIADALEVVELKFVHSDESLDSAVGYAPDFAHQHFGDSEKIVGYTNPKVSICYADASLFQYPQISYDEKVQETADIKADDILYKLRDQLPQEHMDCMVESKSKFLEKLRQQEKFEPFGQMVGKFMNKKSIMNHEMQVYKVTKSSPDFDLYLARVQTLALWYVDAADYTDNTDERYFHYMLFETVKTEEGNTRYRFAGYCTLYRFYHHPDLARVRIAHILLLPQYHKCGNGSNFLRIINEDLRGDPKVYDITAETPQDNFLYARDFVDCVSCLQLPEFAKDAVRKPYTKELEEAMRIKLKIHKRQARRVYEIIRLAFTNMALPLEKEAYEKSVKRRIELPLLRKKSDFNKLTKTLSAEEAHVVLVTGLADKEQRDSIVNDTYEHTLAEYKTTIERLRKHNHLD